MQCLLDGGELQQPFRDLDCCTKYDSEDFRRWPLDPPLSDAGQLDAVDMAMGPIPRQPDVAFALEGVWK